MTERPKLLAECGYPLTAAAWWTACTPTWPSSTSTPDGFVVRELVAGTTPDDLRAVTAAPLHFAADLAVLVPT